MSLALDAIYAVVAALGSPFWATKKREGWRERFGHTPELVASRDGKPRLLIHAVSVGETNLIRPLVEELRGRVDLVIAATTDTGIARAEELYGGLEGVSAVVRYPLDASWMVRRFLDAVQPDGVALVELELWPNFADACARRGIPVAIVNGRLSDRSHKRYAIARPVLGKRFARLAFVAAQEARYAERFVAAGARPDRVRVVGSMKWDAAPAGGRVDGADELAEAMGIDRSRPLIVVGSSAPEEHALLRDATPEGVQLLCAPRRPEWWDDAAQELAGCARRSKGGRGSQTGRFLLDTIGELRKAYALADLVVIGRSFGELHGSDPMEPAALGTPLVMGPRDGDFRESVAALREAGALVQTTREGVAGVIAGLMADSARRARMGEAAQRCVEERRGATARHAAMLLEMLPVRSGAGAHA